MDVQVADQSIATAEATHSDPAGGSYAAVEPGADTTPEIRSEVETVATDKMAKATDSDIEESAKTSAS